MKKKQFLTATFAATAPAADTGRRKDFVFYSGAEIKRYDFWTGEDYTIQFSMKPSDVRLEQLANAPLLKDHRATVDNTIGHIENARIENGQAMGTAVFAETDDVTPVWEKVQAGHITDVSMGVEIDRLELLVDDKKAKVKRYMAFGWAPQEISVVPIGADPGAAFLMSEEAEGMPKEVLAFLRDLYKQNLAKSGAASNADSGLALQLALAQSRQRQREYTL